MSDAPITQYKSMQLDYLQGWNTWNVKSVLSHVHMPDGLSLNLGVYEQRTGKHLRCALPSKHEENTEKIRLGARTYDGAYTALEVLFHDVDVNIQSTVDNGNLVVLVTPLQNQLQPAILTVECGFLWNRAGTVTKNEQAIIAQTATETKRVFVTGQLVQDPVLEINTSFYSMSLNDIIVVSTNKKYSVAQAQQLINNAKQKCLQTQDSLHHAQLAIKSAVAWNTIYDPLKNRVITPVSRLWSAGTGGYVLYCWDNYFAALLAMLENKFLAYANLIEITSEATPQGFIPNMSTGMGLKSLDRSQPPVGAFCTLKVYRRFQEKWLLDLLFPALVKWNDWFYENRRTNDGFLCWGSNPYQPIYGNDWETNGVDDWFGASLESGLDNSPMYDNIPFDPVTHLLKQADVGLMGMYILDCDSLATIAKILGDTDTYERMVKRKQEMQLALQHLWDDSFGFFCNLRLDTKEHSHCISPTNFYAMFSDTVTQTQLALIKVHFYDENEFYGQWMLPSIARSDPAYRQQDYWRGRIWAPMNLLTYLAFEKQNCTHECEIIRQKSLALFLREWQEHGHIHENYNADTGWGCDVKNSDQFYHWGGLLAVISFL